MNKSGILLLYKIYQYAIVLDSKKVKSKKIDNIYISSKKMVADGPTKA